MSYFYHLNPALTAELVRLLSCFFVFSALIRTHVPCVVTTNNRNMIPLTVFFQLPVAVHLSLGLNPVAAVCPQSGLGLSDHSSAWEKQDSSCVIESVVLPVNYKAMRNIRVDLLKQCTADRLILKNICWEKQEGQVESNLVMCGGFIVRVYIIIPHTRHLSSSRRQEP